MNIADFIPVGKENAVTREQLCRLTGLSDRVNRKLIEVARVEGVVIVNDSDGEGYYISEEEADIRRQYNTNHHRAMSILRQQKLLRQKLLELSNASQMTIDDAKE